MLALLGLAATPAARAQAPWAPAPVLPWDAYYGATGGSTVETLQLAGPALWATSTFSGSLGVVQSTVHTSTDQGQTWQTKVLASYNGPAGTVLEDCWTLDGQTAWAVVSTRSGGVRDGMQLFKSTTGLAGKSFEQVTNPVAGTRLKAVRSFSATRAVALTYPDEATPTTWPFLLTTDGGQTWAPVAQPLPRLPNDQLGSITVLGSHLWVTTRSGQVLHTPDQGQTWQSSTTGLQLELQGTAFHDALHGLAYSSNQLLRTTDGGQTWTPVPYAKPQLLTTLVAVPGAPRHYLSAGASYQSTANAQDGTSLSTDDGATWTTIDAKAHSLLAAGSPTQAWASQFENGVRSNPALVKYAGVALPTQRATAAEVTLYPNPTTNTVTLPAAGRYQRATVVDALGRSRQVVALTAAPLGLALAPFGAGLYTIVLEGAQVRQSTAVVVLP